MKYTVFLDRDGVINMDSENYIKSQSEFEFISKSPEAIALLSNNGFDVIIISNQSGIGRKLFTLKDLDTIFKKMNAGIEKAEGKIKDIFFCPHKPGEYCDCRKPEPGLIFMAKEKHGIDLNFSCMVGDSAKDIECGQNAGCSKTILVLTGNGVAAQKHLSKNKNSPDYIGRDLFDAAQWIIKNLKQ